MGCSFAHASGHGTFRPVRELLILVIHLLVTTAKLVRPGGVRAVAAESLLLKHQFLISNRCRQRAPNPSALDRFVLGLTTLFMHPQRVRKLGALVKPATLFKFHKALVDRKYRQLFSSRRRRRKPGPKGPSPELIAAIVEMKKRNPPFGCMRIAQRLAHAFGVAINKDVVRRVLAQHFRPGDRGAAGPSWLTFFAHAKAMRPSFSCRTTKVTRRKCDRANAAVVRRQTLSIAPSYANTPCSMRPSVSSTLSAPISVSSRLSGTLPRSAALGDLSQLTAEAASSKTSLARLTTRGKRRTLDDSLPFKASSFLRVPVPLGRRYRCHRMAHCDAVQ